MEVRGLAVVGAVAAASAVGVEASGDSAEVVALAVAVAEDVSDA